MKTLKYLLFAILLAPSQAFGATAAELMALGMPAALAEQLASNATYDADLIPETDGTYDLGSSSAEWQDLHIDGTANIDTYSPIANMTVAATNDSIFKITSTTENMHFDLQDDDTMWRLGMLSSNDSFSLRDQTNTKTIWTAVSTGNRMEVGVDVVPANDGTWDLGSASLEWQDAWFDGVLTADYISTDKLQLPGGTTLPATCSQREVFHDTDSDDCADTGAGDGALCICKTANTWALLFNF